VSGATIIPQQGDIIEWIDKTYSYDYDGRSKFDAIFCIGALPPGRQKEMIKKLRTLLSPGGSIVIGELIWTTGLVSKEFIDYVGVTEGDYCNETSLLDALREEEAGADGVSSSGCEIRFVDVTSVEEYETLLLRNVEKWAILNSADPKAESMLAASRSWNEFGKTCAWNTWSFCTVLACNT
jgi:hypothetical protein